MVCKYCSESDNFIRAHVIPEAFFRELREGQRPPLLVAAMPGDFPKRAPIGVYDEEILCEQCERSFLAADTYGIDVFLKRFDDAFEPVRVKGETLVHIASSVDKQLLLRFFVSVLWRASVSSHEFFRSVKLGPYEHAALKMLRDSNANVPSAFDAVLSRWDDAKDANLPVTAMLNPRRERWDGVNAYRLYLGRIIAYVKMDKRSFRDPLKGLSLQAPGPCHVLSRDLANSNDLRAIKYTVFASEQNRKSYRRT